jgi:hypothetical protein
MNSVVGVPLVVVAAKMENSAPGVVVPTPTFPPVVTMKLVAVLEPMRKEGPLIPFGFRDRSAPGVEVAKPENCVEEVAMRAEV